MENRRSLAGIGRGDDLELLNPLYGKTVGNEALTKQGLIPLLAGLHCHFTWLQKYVKPTPLTLSKESAALKRWIYDTQHHNQPATVDITQKALAVVLACSENQMVDVVEKLEDLRCFLRQTKQNLIWQKRWGTVEAYRYVILSTRAFVAYYEGNYLTVTRHLKRIQTIDLRGPTIQSALLVLLSSFMAHFKCTSDDVRKKILARAVDLDPESTEANHYMWRILRKIRRSIDHTAKPNEIERELVGKVVILASHESWSEEEKKVLTKEMNELKVEPVDFDEFMKNLHVNSISSNVAIAVADIMDRRFQEGLQKFRVLLNTWPENSEILHRAGSSYFASGEKDLGLYLIYRSVLVDDGMNVNYPALFDYSRKLYVWKGNQSLIEILSVLDRCYDLGNESETLNRTRILFTKGAIYWNLHNKDLAFQLWMDAGLRVPGYTLKDFITLDKMFTFTSFRTAEQRENVMTGFGEYAKRHQGSGQKAPVLKPIPIPAYSSTPLINIPVPSGATAEPISPILKPQVEKSAIGTGVTASMRPKRFSLDNVENLTPRIGKGRGRGQRLAMERSHSSNYVVPGLVSKDAVLQIKRGNSMSSLAQQSNTHGQSRRSPLGKVSQNQ